MMTAAKTLGNLNGALPQARGENGYNAMKLAEVMGLSLDELATILNRHVTGLRRNPESTKLQGELTDLVTLAHLMITLESEAYLRWWLRAPIPELRYRTPLSLLLNADGQTQNPADELLGRLNAVLSGEGQ